MLFEFSKYHGTGNDFIIIDNRNNKFQYHPEVIRFLCDRRFGIGADGLMVLLDFPDADFEMRYFNSDGNESTMCGNGGRCMIAFASELSLISGQSRFKAIDGLHHGLLLANNGNTSLVRLEMKDMSDYSMIGDSYFLNTGSPHLVKFVSKAEDINVLEEGRMARYHPDFSPDGTNADFAEIRQQGLFVRSYERGVEDETLSCGTGVTASALAYAILKDLQGGTVEVETKGGNLKVHFLRRGSSFHDIWLEGPAMKVFNGSINI